MIVRSPRPETNWTVIQNNVLRDRRLSFKARGLLIYLLSMPDNWAVSADRIAQTGPDKRDAIRAALKELETAGYVARERHADRRGRWTTRTYVYDQPVDKPVDKTGDNNGDK